MGGHAPAYLDGGICPHLVIALPPDLRLSMRCARQPSRTIHIAPGNFESTSITIFRISMRGVNVPKLCVRPCVYLFASLARVQQRIIYVVCPTSSTCRTTCVYLPTPILVSDCRAAIPCDCRPLGSVENAESSCAYMRLRIASSDRVSGKTPRPAASH